MSLQRQMMEQARLRDGVMHVGSSFGADAQLVEAPESDKGAFQGPVDGARPEPCSTPRRAMAVAMLRARTRRLYLS